MYFWPCFVVLGFLVKSLATIFVMSAMKWLILENVMDLVYHLKSFYVKKLQCSLMFEKHIVWYVWKFQFGLLVNIWWKYFRSSWRIKIFSLDNWKMCNWKKYVRKQTSIHCTICHRHIICGMVVQSPHICFFKFFCIYVF